MSRADKDVVKEEPQTAASKLRINKYSVYINPRCDSCASLQIQRCIMPEYSYLFYTQDKCLQQH